MNVLGDLLGGGIATRHFHFRRVVQQFFRQRFDVVGEGGGEQQILTTRRQFRQYATNIVDETHVEHAVRFVQHQDLYFIELHRILVFQIQQTARGGDQHIHTATQFHHLRINAHAAKHHQRTNVEVFTVFTDVLAHLGGQFAGRGQDQRTNRTVTLRLIRLIGQQLQQGQRKARGFAGAGLGTGHQIATL